MLIRQETADDYGEVYNVVKSAFASAEHSDGTEQDLVEKLRKSAGFVPELSLVAEKDGKIVGHIMFTKIHIADSIQLALAPLSVLGEYQRQGVGKALIKEGHSIAARLGYGWSVVLGDSGYYTQSGYDNAESFGIFPPSFDIPSENFMAIKLTENAPEVFGFVEYASEFGIESPKLIISNETRMTAEEYRNAMYRARSSKRYFDRVFIAAFMMICLIMAVKKNLAAFTGIAIGAGLLINSARTAGRRVNAHLSYLTENYGRTDLFVRFLFLDNGFAYYDPIRSHIGKDLYKNYRTIWIKENFLFMDKGDGGGHYVKFTDESEKEKIVSLLKEKCVDCRFKS